MCVTINASHGSQLVLNILNYLNYLSNLPFVCLVPALVLDNRSSAAERIPRPTAGSGPLPLGAVRAWHCDCDSRRYLFNRVPPPEQEGALTRLHSDTLYQPTRCWTSQSVRNRPTLITVFPPTSAVFFHQKLPGAHTGTLPSRGGGQRSFGGIRRSFGGTRRSLKKEGNYSGQWSEKWRDSVLYV